MIYRILFALFVLVILYISFKNKKPGNFDAYFFDNYSLNHKDIFYTFSASWIGAASIILLSEKAALIGINSLFIIPLPTILSLFALFLLRKKILANENKTIEQIIEKHYGKKFAIISSFIFLWYLILLTSSQMVALGTVGKSFLNIDYRIFIIFSSIIIIIYSSLRGYRAVVQTDRFQLLFIIIGILIIYVFCLFNNPSPDIINLKLKSFSPELILITISFAFAWTVSPVSIQRLKSGKNESSVSKGILFSSFFLLFFFIIIIYIGISFGNIITEIKFPQIIRIVLFMVLVSALFSTIDTMINSSTMSFYFLTEKDVIAGSFLIGILSVIISLRIPSIIKTLGLSSEILTEALFLPIIYSLLKPEHKNKYSGRIIIIIGLISSFLSFGNELFGIKTYFIWPISILFSLPLLSIIFMISLILEERINVKISNN